MNLKQRLALCWRILRANPVGLMEHTNRELPPDSTDDMQALMNQGLRELVLVFGTQGHSGMSASFAVSALEKLLRFQPLRPLTGEADEWMHVADGVWQNLRCSHVFKQADRFDGQAYDIDGIVFVEPNGCTYTGWGSMVPVVFPYTPKAEYVKVDYEGNRL